MPSDLIAAVDETAATVLLHAGEAALGVQSTSGASSLGPLGVAWSASASLSGGTVALAAPDTVTINDLTINYSLSLTLSVDLSFLNFCLPQVCIPIPFDGDVCTPEVCFTFPSLSVPISFSSSATVSADFGLNVHLTSGQWNVDVVIKRINNLDLGAAATLLLSAIGAAISAALLAVPFIDPVLSLAVDIITAAFGLAEVTGLLGAIVSQFVSGLTITVYQHAQTFIALPAAGPFDPDVPVTLTAVAAEVQASDENELALTVDI